jgi:hypothetical protein
MLMGSRIYAPGSGRFLSPDPVYGGSANAYEYGAGDVVGNTDASGNWLDCSPSYTSGWFYDEYSYYTSSWQPYWKVRVRKHGYTLNARCKISHATTVWALNYAALLGTAIGAALGGLCTVGAVLCSVVGAVVGGGIGSFAPTWYSANCPQAHGITIRAWGNIRWGDSTYYWRWWAGGGSSTYGFKYAYGNYSWPPAVCNP